MFCPKCQSEYRAGFTRCSECDVTLVYRLPEPQLVEHSDDGETGGYVVLSTVQGQFAEGQVRSFLEASGIPVEIRREAIGPAYGLTVDGLAATEILVPRELEDDARDLLERADRGELEIEGE